MTELVTPDLTWHESWAETVLEFGEDYPHGSGLSPEAAVDVTRDGCALFVAARLRGADPEATRPEGIVLCDYFWVTDAEEVVGFLALRHELTPWLLEQGGHIGYSVRPSRRRQGHASRALALALIRAKELGLERVLLTCDDDNVGSWRTIENAGGVYEDTRQDKRRYWITTG
jgi:predicted acetyltransferase